MIKAALFDLDGVVFDTESQYSIFWGMMGREYHPEMPDFEYRIKGQTLVQIYDKYFTDEAVFAHIEGFTGAKEEQAKITARLDEFEKTMQYEYIAGFEDFISDLKQHGVKCAVVTSSNVQKMLNVYDRHPEFKAYFDRVLTSEDFAESKPHPDCYLKGAAYFGREAGRLCRTGRQLQRTEGGESLRSLYLGLATTNSREAIQPLSDYVIDDYRGFGFADLQRIVKDAK